MMPEAFEHVGPATGLATTIGFILAFVIATLEHHARSRSRRCASASRSLHPGPKSRAKPSPGTGVA